MTSVVLVWPDARQEAAELLVPDGRQVVADWDPLSEDGGRIALLTSLREARDMATSLAEDPDGLTIVGFGSGAVAAAGLTRYAKRLGIGVARVLCVAPRWHEPDPFSGIPLGDVPEGVELVPDAAAVAAALLAT